MFCAGLVLAQGNNSFCQNLTWGTAGTATTISSVVTAQRIVIPADAFVRLTGTLRLKPGGEIIVNRTATLVVDGGIITVLTPSGNSAGIGFPIAVADYSNGILVDGDRAKPQPSVTSILNSTYSVSMALNHITYNQGAVAFINNGQFRFSKFGVVTSASWKAQTNPTTGQPTTYTQTNRGGGVIIAYNSKFHNHLNSIFTLCNYPRYNVSEMVSNEFNILGRNNNANNAPLISRGIFLQDVNYVDKIHYNTFISQSSARHAIGIDAVNASFNITNQNVFKFLFVGVQSDNFKLINLGRYSITYNTFTECITGVSLRGATNPQINFNSLTLAGGAAQTSNTGVSNYYGILLRGCSRFTIGNNVFDMPASYVSSLVRHGIFIEDCRPAGCAIQNNSFDKMTNGVFSQGDNTGTVMWCNNMTNVVDYDFTVRLSPASGLPPQGVFDVQGLCAMNLSGGTFGRPAGNLFSQTWQFPTSDWNQSPGVQPVYYHYNPNVTREIPIKFSSTFSRTPCSPIGPSCGFFIGSPPLWDTLSKYRAAFESLKESAGDPWSNADSQSIAYLGNSVELIQNELLHFTDSAYRNTDSLYRIVAQDSSSEASLLRVQIHLSKGDLVAAQLLINELLLNFASDSELVAMLNYCNLAVSGQAAGWDSTWLALNNGSITAGAASGWPAKHFYQALLQSSRVVYGEKIMFDTGGSYVDLYPVILAATDSSTQPIFAPFEPYYRNADVRVQIGGDALLIGIQNNGKAEETYQIDVLNMAGQLLASGSIGVSSQGFNSTSLRAEGKGLVIVKVIGNQGSSFHKAYYRW